MTLHDARQAALQDGITVANTPANSQRCARIGVVEGHARNLDEIDGSFGLESKYNATSREFRPTSELLLYGN